MSEGKRDVISIGRCFWLISLFRSRAVQEKIIQSGRFVGTWRGGSVCCCLAAVDPAPSPDPLGLEQDLRERSFSCMQPPLSTVVWSSTKAGSCCCDTCLMGRLSGWMGWGLLVLCSTCLCWHVLPKTKLSALLKLETFPYIFISGRNECGVFW